MTATRDEPRRRRALHRLNRGVVAFAWGSSSLAVLLAGAAIWVSRYGSRGVVIDPAELEATIEAHGITTVIVPGAGVDADGSPSLTAKSRSRTAFGLYDAGLVDRILVSGSVDQNGDEPESMRAFLVDLGADSDDILVDSAGTSTWKTCERAATVFGIESAVITTQREFGPRTALTGRTAGIEPTIAYTPRRLKRGPNFSLIRREAFANLKLAAIATRQYLRRVS